MREGLYAQVLADHRSLIPVGPDRSRRPGSGHPGRRAVRRVLLTERLPGRGHRHAKALEAHAWPAGEHVRVRMGIHTGEASTTATGLVGLDVHRAARVAAVGYGGQVLLSETAAALVRDSLPAEAALKDLGVHRLKDLGRPERIFRLQVPGLQAEFPPLRSLGNPALLNNLPAQLSTFIGRDRELSEVRALRESSRLVTLTGAGGSGKTRLSLQVAAEMLDGAGDGVWLVDPVRSGKLFDEAIACTERSGDQLFAGFLHNDASVHALRVGDIPAARAHLEAAAQASQANLGQKPSERDYARGMALSSDESLDLAFGKDLRPVP